MGEIINAHYNLIAKYVYLKGRQKQWIILISVAYVVTIRVRRN
jgi:hypothetical protein